MERIFERVAEAGSLSMSGRTSEPRERVGVSSGLADVPLAGDTSLPLPLTAVRLALGHHVAILFTCVIVHVTESGIAPSTGRTRRAVRLSDSLVLVTGCATGHGGVPLGRVLPDTA